MKAILMSIKPQYVAKILNGEKTIEVRKRFPKDYRGWVYIYATKRKPYLYRVDDDRFELSNKARPLEEYYVKNYNANNGKVVAKFKLNNVEKMVNPYFPKNSFATYKLTYEELLKQSCLCEKELDKYISKGSYGYVWHIDNLEIFDKPKELSEFFKPYATICLEWDDTIENLKNDQFYNGEYYDLRIRKAPQNWQYVEVVE